MIGYHGDSSLKARFLAHVERHRREDSVMRGTYGNLVGGKWRGCAVGCSIRSLDEIDGKPHRLEGYGNHGELSQRLGIPPTLAHLEDRIFEGLPYDDAMLWPTLFAQAIPVGADLTLVWPRFAHWLLTDPVPGVQRLARTERARAATDGVAALFARQIAGDTVELGEWRAARNAAYNADAVAAYDAADAAAAASYAAADAAAASYAAADAAAASYAASVAACAADAAAAASYAASVAACAADAAADASYAAADARSRHFKTMAEALLNFMLEAPCPAIE